MLDSLGEILTSDNFLQQCCGRPEALAKAIDVLFLNRLKLEAYPSTEQTLAFVPHLFEKALGEFDQALYGQGDFKKLAYFHLYNLDIQGDIKLQPPYEGWHIAKLDPRDIATLFGESSASSFISPTVTGTHFLICIDNEGFDREELYEWLSRRWKDAQPYRQVLQYSIDGIVNIDYACPYFFPVWVNQIHKWGLYYLGEPLREGLPYPFHRILFSLDQEQVNKVWRTYIRYGRRIEARGSTLRKAIRIAGNFFEDYHRKSKRVEQFASLMIALEALFTPSDQSEQTFRISQSCALLSVQDYDSNGRQEVFEFLKQMFKRRGKLFHGQIDTAEATPDTLASDDEIHRLASLVRTSILRFIALYLRGENDLEELRKQLQKAAFDEQLRNDLIERADFEAFIDDTQTSLLPDSNIEPAGEQPGVASEPPSSSD